MIILPSIDLINGRCVRLKQGDFAQQTIYETEPTAMALQFKKNGAKAMHVVDLQGAKQGQLVQVDVIASIVTAFGEGVQAGGGVRTRVDIDLLLANGVSRVVMGTKAVTHPDDIESMVKAYGTERLVFAFDFRLKEKTPYVSTVGWQTDSSFNLWNLLDRLPDFAHVLCTDIGQDGMLNGPNLAIYQTCVQRYPRLYFQSSGGISRLSDIQALQNIGVHGGIIGKALYENNLLLTEAITCLNDA